MTDKNITEKEIRGDLFQDILNIMHLHSAEAGLMIAEENGWINNKVAIKHIENGMENIEGFLSHYKWRIRETKALLKRYRNILQKYKEKTA